MQKAATTQQNSPGGYQKLYNQIPNSVRPISANKPSAPDIGYLNLRRETPFDSAAPVDINKISSRTTEKVEVQADLTAVKVSEEKLEYKRKWERTKKSRHQIQKSSNKATRNFKDSEQPEEIIVPITPKKTRPKKPVVMNSACKDIFIPDVISVGNLARLIGFKYGSFTLIDYPKIPLSLLLSKLVLNTLLMIIVNKFVLTFSIKSRRNKLDRIRTRLESNRE